MHNVFLINKTAGPSSFDIIRGLRRITGVRKMGHAGTLDPFATGLLAVFMGPVTRAVQLLEKSDKTYLATMRLGVQTDTGDVTGNTEKTMPVPAINSGQLAELERHMQGITSLAPHAFSAVKVDGKRAYDLARNGEKPQLAPRPCVIHEFKITKVEDDLITYQCRVSSGTYVRVLSMVAAEFLGTCAYTVALERQKIARLGLDNAVTVAELTPENWAEHTLPLSAVLSHLLLVYLDDNQTAMFKHGRAINLPGAAAEYILVYAADQTELGIASRGNDILQPKMVFA